MFIEDGHLRAFEHAHAFGACTILTVKDFKFDHCSIRALRPDDPSGDCKRLMHERL